MSRSPTPHRARPSPLKERPHGELQLSSVATTHRACNAQSCRKARYTNANIQLWLGQRTQCRHALPTTPHNCLAEEIRAAWSTRQYSDTSGIRSAGAKAKRARSIRGAQRLPASIWYATFAKKGECGAPYSNGARGRSPRTVAPLEGEVAGAAEHYKIPQSMRGTAAHARPISNWYHGGR